MWQRFTERARKVVFYAQEEAQKCGVGYVSTEHLLLGLVREDDNVAARTLEAMGVSLDRIRAEVEKHFPQSDVRSSEEMTLTPRGKQVINLAFDEAKGLNNDYIGTEHLLLGLIREGDGLAGRVLKKLGVELEQARREVIALQDAASGQDSGRTADYSTSGSTPSPSDDFWDRFEAPARFAAVLAKEEALQRGQGYISPEHLLLGLIKAPESRAAQALVALGIDVDALRIETERRCRQGEPRTGTAPWSPAAGHAFTIAYKEETIGGAAKTGPEHLLLGLLREPDGLAGHILKESGVGLEALRAAIKGLDAEA